MVQWINLVLHGVHFSSPKTCFPSNPHWVFFPLPFDLGTMSLKLSEPKGGQSWTHFLDILLKIPTHDKFWLLEIVWKILTYSETFLLFSVFSEVQAIVRNRGRCLLWCLEALSACLKKRRISSMKGRESWENRLSKECWVGEPNEEYECF